MSYQKSNIPRKLNQQQLKNFTLIVAGKMLSNTKADLKAITVYCDLCHATATATREVLLKTGWGIYSQMAFCPTHEDMI